MFLEDFERDSQLTELPDFYPFEPPKLKKKNKRQSTDKLIQCDEYMTICIAAVAQIETEDPVIKDPAIVFAADYQVSSNYLKYNSPISKFQPLTDYAGILFASSNVPKSDEIVADVVNITVDYERLRKKIPIKDIAKLVSDKCIERHNRAADREFRLNWGFMLNNDKTPLFRDIVNEVIKDEIREFNDGFLADFIIIGIDPSPPFAHIFHVNQKGDIIFRDVRGWEIKGSGTDLAYKEFMRCRCASPICECGYQPATDLLSNVTIRVYKAKKAAEIAGRHGIGESTAFGVIRAKGGKIGIQYISNFIAQKIIGSEMEVIKKFEKVTDQETVLELDNELEEISLTFPSEFIWGIKKGE
ncbi:MAG: hypothetical protein ABSB80_02235 [Methanoregula sp.]|uniref:hypothetical protein n=1 Tax=Methanoregula sp. TaxID=2052170 RepID=UPI003D145C9B